MSRGFLKYMLLFGLLAGCGTTSRQEAPVSAAGLPVITEIGAVSSSGQETLSVKEISLSDGPGIARLINNKYNDTATSCTQSRTGAARGLYFCSGVLLRTTDNGPFNPWEPSPTALQLYGTSYSWIRHDLLTDTFYKRAGFILLSPADILSGAVPDTYFPQWGSDSMVSTLVVCVYPFDAWTTRTMDRRYSGCGFERTGLERHPQRRPWGSCDDELGYRTATEWNNYFNSRGQRNYEQCSWNADNSQGWLNMIASHNESAYSNQASWNEVMLYNCADAPHVIKECEPRMWTVAFFYDAAKPGALADARAFQQKMAATGRRVPILKLDFSAPASSRFTYQVVDQAPGFYP